MTDAEPSELNEAERAAHTPARNLTRGWSSEVAAPIGRDTSGAGNDFTIQQNGEPVADAEKQKMVDTITGTFTIDRVQRTVGQYTLETLTIAVEDEVINVDYPEDKTGAAFEANVTKLAAMLIRKLSDGVIPGKT